MVKWYLLTKPILILISLREYEHPSACSLEEEQAPLSVPIVGLIEIEVFVIDVIDHPCCANERSNRTEDELRYKYHDDLPVGYLHQP